MSDLRLFLRTLAASAAIATCLLSCGGGGEDVGAGTSLPANSAVLTWDPVSASSLAGYRIYYGTSSGQYFQASGQGIAVGPGTTYSVTGLNSGVRYYFAATAYDNANNESSFSNEVFKDVP
jgi:hypothetical protein